MWRHLAFGRKSIFYQHNFSCDEGRENGKRGLYQENRVDVLENSHPVVSKLMS